MSNSNSNSSSGGGSSIIPAVRLNSSLPSFRIASQTVSLDAVVPSAEKDAISVDGIMNELHRTASLVPTADIRIALMSFCAARYQMVIDVDGVVRFFHSSHGRPSPHTAHTHHDELGIPGSSSQRTHFSLPSISPAHYLADAGVETGVEAATRCDSLFSSAVSYEFQPRPSRRDQTRAMRIEGAPCDPWISVFVKDHVVAFVGDNDAWHVARIRLGAKFDYREFPWMGMKGRFRSAVSFGRSSHAVCSYDSPEGFGFVHVCTNLENPVLRKFQTLRMGPILSMIPLLHQRKRFVVALHPSAVVLYGLSKKKISQVADCPVSSRAKALISLENIFENSFGVLSDDGALSVVDVHFMENPLMRISDRSLFPEGDVFFPRGIAEIVPINDAFKFACRPRFSSDILLFDGSCGFMGVIQHSVKLNFPGEFDGYSLLSVRGTHIFVLDAEGKYAELFDAGLFDSRASTLIPSCRFVVVSPACIIRALGLSASADFVSISITASIDEELFCSFVELWKLDGFVPASSSVPLVRENAVARMLSDPRSIKSLNGDEERLARKRRVSAVSEAMETHPSAKIPRSAQEDAPRAEFSELDGDHTGFRSATRLPSPERRSSSESGMETEDAEVQGIADYDDVAVDVDVMSTLRSCGLQPAQPSQSLYSVEVGEALRFVLQEGNAAELVPRRILVPSWTAADDIPIIIVCAGYSIFFWLVLLFRGWRFAF
eukprot:ANDGO_08129.mRNA.1 hypothetical protein